MIYRFRLPSFITKWSLKTEKVIRLTNTKRKKERNEKSSSPLLFLFAPDGFFIAVLERRLAIICKTRDKKTKIEAEGLKT
jgi:hypothetical protein